MVFLAITVLTGCAEVSFNNPFKQNIKKSCTSNCGGGGTVNRNPFGTFDQLSVTPIANNQLRIQAAGWAFDPDTTQNAIVAFTAGGPLGVGILLGDPFVTNVLRTDVNNVYQLASGRTVGFALDINIPNVNIAFDVYAYVADTSNISKIIQLNNSPKNYRPKGAGTGVTLLAINSTKYTKEKYIKFTIPYVDKQQSIIPNYQVKNQTTNARAPVACRKIASHKNRAYIRIAGCMAKMTLVPGRNEFVLETASSAHPQFQLHSSISNFLTKGGLTNDLYFAIDSGVGAPYTARINPITDSPKVINLGNGHRIYQYVKRKFFRNNGTESFPMMLWLMIETYHQQPTGKFLVSIGNNDFTRYGDGKNVFQGSVRLNSISMYYKDTNLKIRAHEPEAWGFNQNQTTSSGYKKIEFATGLVEWTEGQTLMRPFDFAFTSSTSGAIWNTLLGSGKRSIAIADYQTWKKSLESMPGGFVPKRRFNNTQLNDARNRLDHYFTDAIAFKPVRNPRRNQGSNRAFLNIGYRENSDWNAGPSQDPPQAGDQSSFSGRYIGYFIQAFETGHSGPMRIPLLAMYKTFLRGDSYLDLKNGKYDLWKFLDYDFGNGVAPVWWNDSSGQGWGPFYRCGTHNRDSRLAPHGRRCVTGPGRMNKGSPQGAWTTQNVTHFQMGYLNNLYDMSGDYYLYLRIIKNLEVGLATHFTANINRTDSERSGRMHTWMIRGLQYLDDYPALRDYIRPKLEQKLVIYRNAYFAHYNNSNNPNNVPGVSYPIAQYWMMGFAMEYFAEAKLYGISPVQAQEVLDLFFNRSSLWMHPETNRNNSNYGVFASFIDVRNANITWFPSSYSFAERWASGIIFALHNVMPANTNTNRVNRYVDRFFKVIDDPNNPYHDEKDRYWIWEDRWVVPRAR